MDTPQTPFYRKDALFRLADVRDVVNRRRDPDPDPVIYSEELGYREFEVLAALEALVVEGEVLA